MIYFMSLDDNQQRSSLVRFNASRESYQHVPSWAAALPSLLIVHGIALPSPLMVQGIVLPSLLMVQGIDLPPF